MLDLRLSWNIDIDWLKIVFFVGAEFLFLSFLGIYVPKQVSNNHVVKGPTVSGGFGEDKENKFKVNSDWSKQGIR